ncbi:hypothetical protein PAT3040_03128 [Paenibacillus agaridevorans]|uniref:S-layer protein n=1 Tax=Paenibacillus agaridevorans TaxID=171404 RepID=A0A2R5EYS8_9BACL|nr:hypothetical protein [Paenibacillus agaridevorans]GBG08541.1 hypothetical protein PAT3040_03128 [Paenibacillus agaridevorans]
MRKRLIIAAITVCMLLLLNTTPGMAPSAIYASDETWTENELNEQLIELNAVIASTSRPQLVPFLETVRDEATAVVGSSDISFKEGLKTKKAMKYALKLAKDATTGSASELWTDTPFIVYEAAALSPEKRLPNTLPTDGAITDQLNVISAQDEYEAASFVLAPLSDVDSVTFAISDLQGTDSVIPASAIDMHVIKTWYQGGTAWQSYFFDGSKNVLVPELLLHDENLVRVDHELEKNYIRVDYPEGSQYVDVFTKPNKKFDHLAEPVEDSPVLLPIELKQGESKQMWITTKVDAGTPEGFYTGTIDITADGVPAGQITLKIRVLPFDLPDPKTYYDVDKDFYVMLYHESRVREYMKETGGNAALVDEKLANEYRNMAEHNAVNIPAPIYNASDSQYFFRQLELMEGAGLELNPLFGAKQTFPEYTIFTHYSNYLNWKAKYEADPTPENQAKMDQYYTLWRQGIEDFKPVLDEAFATISNYVGHTNIYFDGWDEAGWSMLQFQQELWRYIQDELGGKVFASGHGSHLELETKEQFLNWAGEMTREQAANWHALGEDKLITSYAYPHTGPENPDLMRQRHGMWLYKANYDATYNYIYYENFLNTWNDDVDATYRQLALVYPTQTDIIDTLAWEGFREGIDDIRYATKLQQVAQDAIASGQADRVAAANKALNWLEVSDERSMSADLIRLEMIYHILRMLELAE